MNIDELQVQNFKSFDNQTFSFHPKFNLIIGSNGTGKTSALDALAVAVGSWFLGVRGADSRHIRPNEVTLKGFKSQNDVPGGDDYAGIHFEKIFPCVVYAKGKVQGEMIDWTRSLNGPESRTTYSSANLIKQLAVKADAEVRKGGSIPLPLISYYGTGRLWQEPRDSYQVNDPFKLGSKEEQSRFAGYWNSVDPRLSVAELTRWIARQTWIAFQNKKGNVPVFSTVKKAIIGCIEGAVDLYFDPDIGEVIVEMQSHSQPFSNLSDGQRSMLAMIGDLAQKAAKLNPQYGEAVLNETEGIVLIDELDLHLHPLWQQQVIDDLTRTFPKIQFICTTHSPFIIQSMRDGQIIKLGESGSESNTQKPVPDTQNPETENSASNGEDEEITYLAPCDRESIEDIAEDVQGVPMPQMTKRRLDMLNAAEEYYKKLHQLGEENAEVETLRKRVDELAIPFGDDPAFSALLKFERDTFLAKKAQNQ